MKNLLFFGLVSLLIYSCIPEDKFILPEPVNQTVSNSDTLNQQNDTPSSTISGGGSGASSDTSNSNQSEIIQNDRTCSPDTIYFEQSILPLIISNCALSGCHDSKTAREGYDYTNYKGIMKSVNKNSPSKSELYTILFDNGSEGNDDDDEKDDDSNYWSGYSNISLNSSNSNHSTMSDDRMPPKPMDPLNDTQKSTILKWIQQGALNNSCNESANSENCDLTNITYSKTIVNIVNTYCLGCHNTNSGQNATLLNNYANVKAQVDNGKFLGTIQHSQGFIPMPSADTKLDPCTIEKIKTWINDGAPNN